MLGLMLPVLFRRSSLHTSVTTAGQALFPHDAGFGLRFAAVWGSQPVAQLGESPTNTPVQATAHQNGLIRSYAAAADAGGESGSTSQPSKSAGPSYGPRLVTPLKLQTGPVTQEGTIFVITSFNNTLMALVDSNNKTVTTVSAGCVGFKNAGKSKPIAAEKTAEEIARRAKKHGFSRVIIKLKGSGNNKQYAVMALHSSGLNITQLMDVTGIPYNGCRPKKKRRV